MDFKERLKELRKAKGLSQATLAERLGMSKSTIGMYETGDIKPSVEAIEALAEFFNVNKGYLMGEEDYGLYYMDPAVVEMARELYERPDLRVLFDASKNATTEDVQMAADLLDRLSKK